MNARNARRVRARGRGHARVPGDGLHSEHKIAANSLAAGRTEIAFNLSWGKDPEHAIHWRASTGTLIGRQRDGAPFEIADVTAGALEHYLRGAPAEVAFPRMDPADLAILISGDPDDD